MLLARPIAVDLGLRMLDRVANDLAVDMHLRRLLGASGKAKQGGKQGFADHRLSPEGRPFGRYVQG